MPGVVRPRGRLFRKYVVLFVALVSGALVVSGALEIYFSYEENKVALAQLQREKAVAAANRIEAVREGDRTADRLDHPSPARDGQGRRRAAAGRLLPPPAPGARGDRGEPARRRGPGAASRLSPRDGHAGSQADFSKDPRFLEAREGRTYFSPVYFRKESEPYMTVALSSGAARASPWPRSTSSSSGTSCPRSRSARPDTPSWSIPTASSSPIPTSAWCSRRATSRLLEQVRAARAATGPANAQSAVIAADLQGRQVLTAYATISPLRWMVFVEQPLVEAFEGIRSSILARRCSS